MYKTKIGYACCIALFLLFAGCGKEIPAENMVGNGSGITKEPEHNQAQDQTEEAGTPDIPEEPEASEKADTRAEMELVEYTYPFYELWCAANAEDSYETTDDGACRVIFSEKYSKWIFALPEGINMTLCDHVTVKAKSEYGDIGVYLYDHVVFSDPWDMHVYAEYDFGGEDVQEFSIWPRITDEVWGVGIISVDEVEDFSKYAVDIYSVTFYMKREE